MALEGSLLCIRIDKLNPYQLPLAYTVTLKSSDGTLQGVVSPYSYIRMAVQGNDMKLQNLCKAMYLYGEAAQNYIGKN